MASENNEVELARALLAGDVSALESFIAIFQPKVFHFSLLTCGQREDAEEVAQETLLRVFESFGQLRDPEHVRAWVFRIAKNYCLMKRRKSAFAPKQELSLEELRPDWRQEEGERKLDIADWSALPEEAVAQAQMHAILRQAIEQLPDLYRSVVLLRDVEELSTAETAHILDVSEDVVKTRLHRARLAIRKKLDDALKARRVATNEGAPV